MTEVDNIEDGGKKSNLRVDDIKDFLSSLKDDPDDGLGFEDNLDRIIFELIQLEKQHLYQIEKPSTQKRMKDIRKLIEGEIQKLMDLQDDS